MVTLQDVNRENWIDCAKLALHDHQLGYVANNVFTIAESKYYPHHQLRAIHDGERVVGMLAYCHEDEPIDLELYWVFRLLIDRDHQRRGHGFDAMPLALHAIRQRGAKRVRTMHKPNNAAAAALYRAVGFEPIGTHVDGDTLLELRLA